MRSLAEEVMMCVFAVSCHPWSTINSKLCADIEPEHFQTEYPQTESF